MNAETNKRRSTRVRQSVNYNASPIDSPVLIKSARKSLLSNANHDANTPEEKNVKSSAPKTPKTNERVTRKATDDSSAYSPKKLRQNRTPSLRGLEMIVIESSPTINQLESPKTSKPRRTKAACKTNEQKTSPIYIASSDDEKSVTSNNENLVKPSTLFDIADDVEGKQLFPFKTPKKKSLMGHLAQTTPKTPHYSGSNRKTPTSRSSLSEIINTPTSRPSASKTSKTPKHVREANKRSKIFNYFHK